MIDVYAITERTSKEIKSEEVIENPAARKARPSRGPLVAVEEPKAEGSIPSWRGRQVELAEMALIELINGLESGAARPELLTQAKAIRHQLAELRELPS
jgi:hypothetical protein